MTFTLPFPPNPAAWFAHGPATTPTLHRRRVGQWTLEIIHDPFTDRTSCRLHAHAMTYGPVAVTFQFPASENTFGATYKIDDGPATSWRVNAMTLASRGVALQTEDLTNPSGGRVLAPVSALINAHSITIRPSAYLPARTFKLADLPAALEAGRAAGCGAELSPELGG
jgi:hypothetical protein